MHKWQNILPGFLDALEVLSEDFSSHLKAICQIVPALLSMRNRLLLMFFGIFLNVIFLLLNLSMICIWNILLLHLTTIQLLDTLIRNLLYLLQVPAVWCLLLFLFDCLSIMRRRRPTVGTLMWVLVARFCSFGIYRRYGRVVHIEVRVGPLFARLPLVSLRRMIWTESHDSICHVNCV